MRVLIFDHNFVGHTPEWIYCAAEACNVNSGNEIVVAANLEIASVRFWVDQISCSDFKSVDVGQDVKSRFKQAISIAKKYACDLVFFPYFDDILIELGNNTILIEESSLAFRGVILRPEFEESALYGTKDRIRRFLYKFYRTKYGKELRRELKFKKLRFDAYKGLLNLSKKAGCLKFACVGNASMQASLDEYYPDSGSFVLKSDPWLSKSGLTREQARDRLNLPSDKFIFLHCGTSFPVKGLHDACTAINMLGPELKSKLMLVRAGKLWDPDLKPVIDSLGRLVDEYIDQEDLNDYYAAADCVLMPYRNHTGSSGVLIHSAANRRPVITPDYAIIGDFTTRCKLGYLYKHLDLDSLADAMRRAIEGSYIQGPEAKEFVELNSKEKFFEELSQLFR
jgi:glycosyltransferase involved in cell wall biosynthesis